MSVLHRLAQRAGAASRFAGWHPLLFAAYPVLFLWSQNPDELPPGDALPPLIAITAIAFVVTIAVALVIGDRARAALIVTPIALGLLLYGHVANLVSLSPRIQELGWAALAVLGLLGAWRLSRARLLTVDRALSVVGVVLILFTLVPIAPEAAEAITASAQADVVPADHLATTTTAPKRDVYWLIFDRYPSNNAIQLQFGIQNALPKWLTDHGFDVLADSHANYLTTLLSISTTSNMRHLDALGAGAPPGPKFTQKLTASLQDSLVARQFKALGYRYEHMGSWFTPTRVDRGADVNYNATGASDFSSVLLAESALPTLLRPFGLGEQSISKNYQHGAYELAQLDKIPADPGPKFVWGHILLPHPAYVFNENGSFMSAAEVRKIGETEAWRRQVTYTNTRLEAFLSGLLALPADKQPIIIIQADEGHRFNVAPTDDAEDKGSFDWSKATPEQLEIKFGILNAWYVPGGADLGLDQKQTAINTFPILFSRYFGLDYPLLPDTVYTSLGPVDRDQLLDITDRLPTLK